MSTIKLKAIPNIDKKRNKKHAIDVQWFNQPLNARHQLDLALDNLILHFGLDAVKTVFKTKLNNREAA